MNAPMTGTRITSAPRVLPTGEMSALDQRWKKKRFVNSPMSLRRARATKAPRIPIQVATIEMKMTRLLAVKSPSSYGPVRFASADAFCNLPSIQAIVLPGLVLKVRHALLIKTHRLTCRREGEQV